MSNKEHKTSLSNGSGSGFGEFDFLDGSKYEGGVQGWGRVERKRLRQRRKYYSDLIEW